MATAVADPTTDALALYRDSDVVDLHIDSYIWTRTVGYDLHKRNGTGPFGGKWLGQVDLPRVIDAGLDGTTWSITTNPLRTGQARRDTFFKNLAELETILDGFPGVSRFRNVAEYRAAKDAGHHAACLAIQGGNAIDFDLDDVERLRNSAVLRVTVMGFTHSSLGEASETIPKWLPRPHAGLTDRGRDFVKRLNDVGVLVDLAHASRKAFWDALDAHDDKLPPAVTHAGADAVTPHIRNLTDPQIRALADRGGMVGIIFKNGLLGKGADAELVARHLEHFVRVGGEDVVALGADWDGFNVPPTDLRFPNQLPHLVAVLLRRGWSESAIRKLLGGNVLRVLSALRG
jgi:membrane dipeptidase